MNALGLYVPGNSLLHKATAGPKLAALAVAAVVVGWLPAPEHIGIAAICTVLGIALAGIPPRTAFAQISPVLWLAIPLLAFQWAMVGPAQAVVVVGRLLVLVMLAALITLTTRVLAMVDTFERLLRPFTRFGVRPQRVALVLALAVRCVPLVAQAYHQAREAQRARGLEWSPQALVVPLTVRLLRKADAIGEALAARGLDEDD